MQAFVLLSVIAWAAQSPPRAAVFATFLQQYDQLECPTSVAIATNGDWAVVERDERRVRIFGADGQERHAIDGGGQGAAPTGTAWDLAFDAESVGPTAVTFTPEQRLTIVSPSRIAIFDLGASKSDSQSAASGAPWRVVAGLDLGYPTAAAWNAKGEESADDELWIADRRGRVLVLDSELTLKRQIDRASGALFQSPAGLAIAPDGSVFVSDRDADAVVRLDANGTEVARFGERGAFPGLFNAPAGLAVHGECLYVTDELNHRITVHGFDGAFRSFWGMHAVIPREGDGKIHYPSTVAIAPDGSFALVSEPLERRVQRFAPSDPEEAMKSGLPSKAGVQSHFGGAVACDGELLLLEEPESSSVFLFDLRGPTPIHVTTFGAPGAGPDRLSRVSALAISARTQRAVVADLGYRKLSQTHLDRDPSKPLKMDPFMSRLVRSWDLDGWSERARSILPTLDSHSLEPNGLAWQHGSQGDKLWVMDRRVGALVEVDDGLAPVKVLATGLVGARGLAITESGVFVTTLPEHGRVVWIDAQGTILRSLRAPTAPRGEAAPAEPLSTFVRPNAVSILDDTTLAVTDAGRDEVVLLTTDGQFLQRIGKRGESDGDFWMPEGITSYTGAAIETESGAVDGARFVVVDRGNHRAQVFRRDGGWLMTFGLGRAFTRPRERGES